MTITVDPLLESRRETEPSGAGLGDSLQRLLLQAVSEVPDADAAAKSVAQVLALALRPLGIWRRVRVDIRVDTRDESNETVALRWTDWAPLVDASSMEPPALADDACDAAIRRAATVHLGPPDGVPYALLITPVLHQGPAEVLVAAIPWELHDGPRATAQMQMAALTLALQGANESVGRLQFDRRLKAVGLETLRLAAEAESLSHAASLLTNHWAASLGVELAAFGECSPSGVTTLTSVSGVARLDSHGDLCRAFESVMDEALLSSSTQAYDEAADNVSLATAKPLARMLGAQVVVALPVVDDEQGRLGVWLIAGDSRTLQQQAPLEQLGGLVRPVLARLKRARDQQGWRPRVRRASQWLRSRPGLATVLAGALLGLAMPWPYTIGCDVTLEPVTRRFVVAPYDGILEEQLVETGDVVREGQVLATLDGRELRIRQSAMRADLSAEIKRRDAARARGDHAEAQIAGLRVESLQQELNLAQHRWTNLDVRAPIGGIIVAGDLEQAEGAPLEQGQTLYEVSPLDQMVVEVLVPEEEVRHVKPGASVRVWLDAFPHRSLRGTVQRVHPRAEMRDDRSVFVADVRVANEGQLLRPGMNGRARLRGPIRPVAWNLFHRAAEKLLAKLGW
ncbi:MAG: HlyD family efflux transporter periplasmic adaptor subunit [Planctomycetales bacterium]|nr:HlyD family efflux transporter periplasmic adaptor subunit [Planctomycetales bacterium]